MLDILLFRTDRGGNPDLVRETLRRRGQDVNLVDRVIELDTEWRRARGDLDDKSAALNQLNKQIGAKKKAKEDCADLLAQQPAFKSEIAALTELVERLEKQVNEILREMGNIVHESVPVSMNEDDNGLVKLHGEPKQIPNGRSHRDLIYMIDGADFERGSEVAGHSGFFFKGIGVQLNLALINYGIQFLVSKGFTPLQPPYFINRDVMGECAQLSQFDEELYKVETGHESDTKYLIATSEQPIAAFHRKEWIDPKDLPLKYAGWSSCFRKEAGHGKDASGLYRVHQFDKIEQFVITKPEDSWAMHEEMLSIAEEFYQSLGFSYRVVSIVTGALNNAAAKKLDLEAWFPIYKEYKELVSCSNCTDYQSRRLGIRIQAPGSNEKQYVHMLNCTLTATTRTICCILENYQTPEGIVVPEVLRPFILGAPALIPYVREPPKEKASKKK